MSTDPIQQAIEALENAGKALNAFISEQDETCEECGINPAYANQFCEAQIEQIDNALGSLRQHQQDRGWRDISTAPEGEDILVRWAMRELDEDDQPTGKITSISTVIAQKRGGYWEDYGAMENTSAEYRGDDDETAFAPECWQPLPPAPKKENDDG